MEPLGAAIPKVRSDAETWSVESVVDQARDVIVKCVCEGETDIVEKKSSEEMKQEVGGACEWKWG